VLKEAQAFYKAKTQEERQTGSLQHRRHYHASEEDMAYRKSALFKTSQSDYPFVASGLCSYIRDCSPGNDQGLKENILLNDRQNLTTGPAHYTKHGRSATKPGTLLRKQIPVRTNQWDESRPEYLEAGTVAHCLRIHGRYVCLHC
jgi:hypothetical protein